MQHQQRLTVSPSGRLTPHHGGHGGLGHESLGCTERVESWDFGFLLIVTLLCSLVQSVLPSLWRIANGIENPWVAASRSVTLFRVVYAFMAFWATMHWLSTCGGLILRLQNLRLRLLAILYLATPYKRRGAFCAQYRVELEKLVLISDDQNFAPFSRPGDQTELQKQGSSLLRCVLSAKAWRVLEVSELDGEADSSAISCLEARRFGLLQTLLRANMLVLRRMHSICSCSSSSQYVALHRHCY